MSSAKEAILIAREATFAFGAGPVFLQPISLDVARGDCLGILGPNGAGKSTLLRLLGGLARPRSGEVLFDGRPLPDQTLRDRAQRIALLPQHPPKDLPLTSRQIVMMGRYPHRRLGLFESAEDHLLVEQALAATLTLEFADRLMSTLSGGEAQRVHIAAALAQAPSLLLLDEPLAALDLYHQLYIFDLLREMTRAKGMTVVIVTHDVNLAARFCTKVVLLNRGRCIAVGPPAQVVCSEQLGPVYEVELEGSPVGRTGSTWLVPVAPRSRRADGAQGGGPKP